jgi:hypothetical protein
MKTNLDETFKTDLSCERDGIWLEISDTIAFKVKRFGGVNQPELKRAFAKYYKPYAKQIENGTLSPDKEREVTTRTFVEVVLVDWRGIEIDGKEEPFTKELAIKFFLELPELFELVIKHATSFDNYRADLGNF